MDSSLETSPEAQRRYTKECHFTGNEGQDFLFFLQNKSSDKVYVHFQCRFGHELEFLNHLVADQVPFLFIVILSEEPGFVWRQVHRILKI